MEDDERSSVRRTPRYPGEDLSPTSKKELLGWYIFGLAAEVFAVCGVGSFLPITLEQLAREQGVFVFDGVTSCMSNVTENAGGINSITLFGRDHVQIDKTCVVHLLGTKVNTASFAMYTFSLAVLVQALVLVSCSSMADYGNYRKTLLVVFGLTGSTATMLFLIVVPSIFLVGSLLVIIAVTCLGSSFVLLNSFLPLLVTNHPSLAGDVLERDVDSSSVPLEAWGARASNSTDNYQHYSANFRNASSGESTQSSKDWNSKVLSLEIQLSAQISSRGVGIGYGAAVFVQIISILLLFSLSKSNSSSASSKTFPLRLVLFLVGAWWFVFTFVSSIWLRKRPGPPLDSSIARNRSVWRSCVAYSTFAWISLWQTIKVAIRLRQVAVFLMAWILLSDAIATVSGTAILFAKTELNMSTPAVAALSIISTMSGIAGAFSWPIISKRLGMRPNQTIIACIALFEIIPIYGLMGYLPFLQKWGVGGLQQPWEIYPLGFIHGFVMGGLSSYCRSFFGMLIPPGSEAAFYALYAITDKGSSVIGPAVVGAIVDAYGHIRPAFWFLAVIIVLPAPLIWLVDADRGRDDAVVMAEKMRGFKGGFGNIDNTRTEEPEEREGLLDEGIST